MTTLLPRSWYTDPDHFQVEMDAVFGRAWLPVAHGTELAEPGSYRVITVGGRDIFVVRGEDDEIRAFYNVCQHRAHRLLDGAGQLNRTIVCPYHAWTYDLTGALRGAPNAKEIAGFDPSCFGLQPVRAALFAGFVTVCFDDAVSQPPANLRQLESLLLHDHPELPAMGEVRRREAVLNANWKTIIENYLECYHCNVAHPSFGNFDLPTWKHLVGDGWSRQGRVATGSNDDDIGQGDIIGLSAWWQWPNIFWARALGADTFVAVFHEPLDPGHTLQTRLVFAASGEEDADLLEFNELFDRVFQEDVSIVENVQRGLASKGYRGGALMAQPAARAGWSEHGVRHFQDLMRGAMGNGAPG
jgi:choline monooxygenase